MRDAVIAGADRDDLTVLVFPDVEACRKIAGAAGRRAACCGAGQSQAARRIRPPPHRAGAAKLRQLDQAVPDDPDGRAAVARCRRSHRQGLDQPARGLDPAKGPGG